jgi:O-antigen/teichoic acid export membrane protein
VIEGTGSRSDIGRTRAVLTDAWRLYSVNIVLTILSLPVIVIVARVLSRTELAALPFATTASTLVATLSSLGLTTLALREVPALLADERKREAVALLRLATVVFIIGGAVGGALTFFGADLVAAAIFRDPAFSPVVRVLAVATAFGSIASNAGHALQATSDFRLVRRPLLYGGLTQQLGSLGGVLTFGYGGFLGGVVLGQAVTCLVALAGLWRAALRLPSAPLPLQALLSARPYYANSLVRVGLMQSDQILVGTLLGAPQLAGYFIAKRFVDYLHVLLEAGFAALAPRMAAIRAGPTERREQAFAQAARLLLLVIVPISVTIAALAGPLLSVVGGPRYVDAAPQLVVLAGWAIAYGIYSLYHMSVYMFGTGRALITVEVTGAAVVLTLGAALSLAFGGLGMALAKFLAFGVGTVVAARVLSSVLAARWDFTFVLRMAALALMGLLVAFALALSILDTPAQVVATALLLVAIVTATTRILTPSDVELIRFLLRLPRAREHGPKERPPRLREPS